MLVLEYLVDWWGGHVEDSHAVTKQRQFLCGGIDSVSILDQLMSGLRCIDIVVKSFSSAKERPVPSLYLASTSLLGYILWKRITLTSNHLQHSYKCGLSRYFGLWVVAIDRVLPLLKLLA